MLPFSSKVVIKVLQGKESVWEILRLRWEWKGSKKIGWLREKKMRRVMEILIEKIVLIVFIR